MSVAEIKKKILNLPDEERQNLSVFLATMHAAADSVHRRELAEKIDDKNSENWIDLEDFKRQLQDQRRDALPVVYGVRGGGLATNIAEVETGMHDPTI